MQSDSADDTKKNTLIEYAVVVDDAEINHLVRLAYRHSFRSTVLCSWKKHLQELKTWTRRVTLRYARRALY